jgi:hypothetical protein
MADPVRLPKSGRDHGEWGDLLNAFLSISHNADGTLKLPGAGDYINLVASKNMTATHAPSDVAFDKIAGKRGDSFSWLPKEAARILVASDGVYAVTLNVNWNDPGSNPTLRFAQIVASDPFHTEEQRVSTPGMNTIQSLSMVATLYKQQSIHISLEQRSGNDQTPYVSITVVKIGGVSNA